MTREEAKRILYVYRAVNLVDASHREAFDMAISELEQEPKTGRWMATGYDGYADGNPVYDWWECSECGWEHTGDGETLTPYCPNCGAKME